jgi:S-adenosylmethionine-diacylgycerolhomoserine-N-methlytransferase
MIGLEPTLLPTFWKYMFDSVNSYYKVQSKIYDLTRWAILFGRTHILNLIPADLNPQKILDLGCGTGKHLLALAELFPEAKITGVDTSKEMLKKASPKIQQTDQIELINSDIESFLSKSKKFDLILCSYSLSMFDNKYGYLEWIRNSLSDSGIVVIVDFDSTPIHLFEYWMNLNHVEISGSLFRILEESFNLRHKETKSAYFGLWKYSFFVGR